MHYTSFGGITIIDIVILVDAQMLHYARCGGGSAATALRSWGFQSHHNHHHCLFAASGSYATALLCSSVILIIPVQSVEAALLAMHCAAEVLRSQTLNQLLKSSSSPLRWLMLTLSLWIAILWYQLWRFVIVTPVVLSAVKRPPTNVACRSTTLIIIIAITNWKS